MSNVQTYKQLTLLEFLRLLDAYTDAFGACVHAEGPTYLPSGPEPSERSVTPRMPDRVTSGTAALTADNPERRSDDEATGTVSVPEMGNRKSSARNSGSARRGTADERKAPT